MLKDGDAVDWIDLAHPILAGDHGPGKIFANGADHQVSTLSVKW